jgi:hypothetical protein
MLTIIIILLIIAICAFSCIVYLFAFNAKIINKHDKILSNLIEKQNQTVYKMTNDLDLILEVAKKLSHAEGTQQERRYTEIGSTLSNINIAGMSEQVSEIWAHYRSRSLENIKIRSIMDIKSQEILEPIKKYFDVLLPKLKVWYAKNKSLTDLELFILCHQEFGDELIRKVSIPANLFYGACVELAVNIAKEIK